MTVVTRETLNPSRADALRFVSPAHALRLGAAHVGGKAFALARLGAAGERVPDWMVLPAEALEQWLEGAGMMGLVRHELATLAALRADAAATRAALERASARLVALVDALPSEDDLLGALCDVARVLGPGPFAVRSSAVGEDGDHLSFAGQYDTVLDVTAGDLADAVHRCWRSAFGVRVLDYRRRSGTLGDAPRLAVIVQCLVRADVAGVLFTCDPVTGARDRMRVSACAGLGEGVVSGSAAADEYLVTRDGIPVAHSPAPASGRLLDDSTLLELARAGARVAEREGGERDIEWAVQGGALFLLQSRPVTTRVSAHAGARAAEPRTVWDNSNIQESYCGVTTPLTFSFASGAYALVYEQTMRALGVDERTIAAHRPMLRNLLGLLRGRVYYNLNNWYRGLLLLPSFRRNKSDMERMMGVEEPVDFVVDERPGVLERARRLPGLVRTLVALLRAFSRLERDRARFMADFESRLRAIERRGLATRELPALFAALDTLQGCLERWTTPIVNDFAVMMYTGRLRRVVARALRVAADDAHVDRTLQALLAGAGAEASSGVAAGLMRLAEIARSDTSLGAILARESADSGALLAEARGASADFAATLDSLLDRYGDRCMGELKLESRSLRDDPAFVVRMLRNYLASPPPAFSVIAARARTATEAAELDVVRGLTLVHRLGFRRTLVRARRAVRAREEMRLARTRLFGAHRDVYRAIGRRLHAAGQLDDAGDVFWLTTIELRAWWEGTAASARLAPMARARREEFAAYARESLPNRVVTTGAPAESVLASVRPAESGASGDTALAGAGNSAPTRLLRGLGCSAGVVEGRVRIVRSPDDDLEIDGHVLVAERTDPGWGPLFPSARAILVERGSLLSHSAVLARELGLPAVVGIPGLMGLLRDGERVRVDGAAGTVERLEG